MGVSGTEKAGEGTPSPGTLGHTVASLFRYGSALRKPRLREAPPKAYPRRPSKTCAPGPLPCAGGAKRHRSDGGFSGPVHAL